MGDKLVISFMFMKHSVITAKLCYPKLDCMALSLIEFTQSQLLYTNIINNINKVD